MTSSKNWFDSNQCRHAFADSRVKPGHLAIQTNRIFDIACGCRTTAALTKHFSVGHVGKYAIDLLCSRSRKLRTAPRCRAPSTSADATRPRCEPSMWRRFIRQIPSVEFGQSDLCPESNLQGRRIVKRLDRLCAHERTDARIGRECRRQPQCALPTCGRIEGDHGAWIAEMKFRLSRPPAWPPARAPALL